MKVIFDKAKVSAAVGPLMCSVSNRSVIPALEGILIEAKSPDICVLTTYDLEKGIRTEIEAKVIEEGSFVINAQKFSQTLKVMGGDEITLTVDDKMVACISCGRSSHRMSAISASDFPAILDLVSDRSFTISEAVLKKMINQISFAMAVNDTRIVLNGCFFKITDNSVLTVACDGFKGAKCERSTELENRNTNGNCYREPNY
jgi:DNA polymerase-3 subunit beta